MKYSWGVLRPVAAVRELPDVELGTIEVVPAVLAGEAAVGEAKVLGASAEEAEDDEEVEEGCEVYAMEDAFRAFISDIEVRVEVTGWRVMALGPKERDECRLLTEVVDLGETSFSTRMSKDGTDQDTGKR